MLNGRGMRLVAGALLVAAAVAAAVWWFVSPLGSDPEVGPGTIGREGEPVEHPEEAVGSTRELSPAPIEVRSRTHAVWSGEELLVWSGAVPREAGVGEMAGNEAFDVVDDGAAYDPTTDTWRRLPDAPIAGRASAAAVWAGDRLVVWGGFSSHDEALDDGAAYLPDEDRWVELPPAPLSSRGDVTAAWTGREVLIVGGAERAGRPGRVTGVQRDGAAYDPDADRWRALPPIPDGVWHLRERGVGPIRERFAGTWTGDALLVWGRDIGLYDPTTDGWERVSAPPTNLWLGGGVQAVSVEVQAAILGLLRRGDPDTFGLTYEPATGTFGEVPALSTAAMQAPRQAIAIGEHGVGLLSEPASAALWRPGATTWRPLPTALARGSEAAVVWTGEELLVWGGSQGTRTPTEGIAWTP